MNENTEAKMVENVSSSPSTNLNYSQITDGIVDNITRDLDMSDYEKKMIVNGLLLVRHELPSTKIGVSNLLGEISKACSDFNYLLNKVRIERLSVLSEYRPQYDHKFTVLTRQSRPSKEAIACEIHYLSPDMASLRDKIERLESILEFLTLQLSVLDKFYKTVESRHYSL